MLTSFKDSRKSKNYLENSEVEVSEFIVTVFKVEMVKMQEIDSN